MSNESPQLQLSNLLHANTSSIPEGLYLKIQSLLREINENTPYNEDDIGYDNVTVNPNDIGMGYYWFTEEELPSNLDILDHQFPLFIYFVLLKIVKNRNRKGYRNADFKFNPEYSEFELNYDIIKTKIIPILQSKGFDVRLHYDCNEFTESKWEYTMNISWEDEYLYDYLNENTELFEKTSEEYHFLNLNRQPGQSTAF